MTGCERFITLIKELVGDGITIQKAIFADGKVKIGDLKLDPGDYLKNENISELVEGDSLLVCGLSDSEFILLCKVVE